MKQKDKSYESEPKSKITKERLMRNIKREESKTIYLII